MSEPRIGDSCNRFCNPEFDQHSEECIKFEYPKEKRDPRWNNNLETNMKQLAQEKHEEADTYTVCPWCHGRVIDLDDHYSCLLDMDDEMKQDAAMRDA